MLLFVTYWQRPPSLIGMILTLDTTVYGENATEDADLKVKTKSIHLIVYDIN